MAHSHDILMATSRDIHGKKAAKFRYEGKTPAVVYGESKKAESVWIVTAEFAKEYKKAGNTSVIDLTIGDKKTPVIVKDVQYHPIKNTVVHVDFYKVNLKKAITADVPVVLIGESPAVKNDNAVIVTIDETVTVEALPDNMPHQIEVDAAKLDVVGAKITLLDLPTSDSYILKDSTDRVFFTATAHKEESDEAETEVVMPEVTTEKVTTEGEASDDTKE